MTRGLILLAWIVLGTWTSSALAQDAAEKTFPHDITLADMAPLKLAIRKYLAISAEPTVLIATARRGERGVVYLCGLTDDGNFWAASILFFAKKANGAVEVEEIDRNSKVDGRAKKLCDTHGFRTPIPG